MTVIAVVWFAACGKMEKDKKKHTKKEEKKIQNGDDKRRRRSFCLGYEEAHNLQ